MLMIWASALPAISTRASRIQTVSASTLTSNTSRQSSVLPSAMVSLRPSPALLIRTSTPPQASRTASNMARMLSSLRRSVGTTMVSVRAAVSSFFRLSRCSALRAARASFMPAWPSRRAVANPIPLDAPVIKAALPAQRDRLICASSSWQRVRFPAPPASRRKILEE